MLTGHDHMKLTGLIQGIDIPDVEIVVQWKVPIDLNTLMQRFGRAARNTSLTGVAVLIAEPRYFYEEYQKQVRKRAGRKRKKAPAHLPPSKRQHTDPVQPVTRPIEDIESEGELEDEDEETLEPSGRQQPLASEPVEVGADEAMIEEEIRSRVGVTASQGGGKKKEVDGTIKLFINASWLRGRKHCRRYHADNYYDNAKIGESCRLPTCLCQYSLHPLFSRSSTRVL